MSYIYKVWIADGKEYFEYANEQTKKKDLPFAESLMDLLTQLPSNIHTMQDQIKTLFAIAGRISAEYCDRPIDSKVHTGKIEQDAFYAWSEKFREEKEKCNSGEISLQEFEQWFKERKKQRGAR